MIRKILVPVRGDGKGDNVLAHAAALARVFNAHIEVTHCRARPEDLLPFGVPIPAILKSQLLKSVSKVSDMEEAGLREEMLALCKLLKLEITENPNGNNVTATFVEEAGRQVDVIRHYGRLADLIAVAQPDVDRNLGANTLKSALFHTGRPVMMCPTINGSAPELLVQNITVAWNGSLEATRAVALTMDIIKAAGKVTILTVGSKHVPVSPVELQEYLQRHGVSADIAQIRATKNVAKTLLDTSAELGADLMISGAYSDSHERETVLGGNTQYIVDGAKMPVILVH